MNCSLATTNFAVISQYGWTALMCAARWGHQDSVRALEALGADMHTQDNVS